MTSVSGWGRHRPAEVTVIRPVDASALAGIDLGPSPLIARGLGRSYGDAAQLEGGNVVEVTACTAIDVVRSGESELIVRCDAGVTIGDLIDRFVPRGWFVPVSPGTRHVTVGGAIAADIHGKNHHADGSFGAHVRRLRLRLADDHLVDVGPDHDQAEAALFWATVGGMGLTGMIVNADVVLTPIATSQVMVETRRFDDLADLAGHMVRSDHDHRFSVAWVDLSPAGHGRSVLTQGSFASPSTVRHYAAGRLRRPWSWSAPLPPLPPVNLVNRPARRVLNELWWHRAPTMPTTAPQSITAFFHPLDAIRDWNRVYGPKGFVQWQCAVPELDVLHEICNRFRHLPTALTVLKRFGVSNPAPLSFPAPGWTLAVDLPATDQVLAALVDLDHLVCDAGGRLYLAKDALLARPVFARMYPRLDEWRAVREQVDPRRRFRSDLADRLGL